MRWTRQRRACGRIAGRFLRERFPARKTNGAEADGKSVWSWHPLLVSSRRRCVGPTGRGHVINSPATVARRIRRRGELAISRKTIAWGMPDVSGASAVNTRAHTSLPQRARGCGCTGRPAFPTPSVPKGERFRQISGATRGEDAETCLQWRGMTRMFSRHRPARPDDPVTRDVSDGIDKSRPTGCPA
jgi:hypothetical protein